MGQNKLHSAGPRVWTGTYRLINFAADEAILQIPRCRKIMRSSSVRPWIPSNLKYYSQDCHITKKGNQYFNYEQFQFKRTTYRTPTTIRASNRERAEAFSANIVHETEFLKAMVSTGTIRPKNLA